MIEFFNLPNLDLLSVGISVAGMAILGFVILFNNVKSASNRTFFNLAITSSVWGIVNYLSYQTSNVEASFWLLRFVMFFAVWSAFFTFLLAYIFPLNELKLSIFYKRVLVSLCAITSFLTLTPVVFLRIADTAANGHILKIINGPGIFIFGFTVTFFNFGGIIILIRKIIRSNKEQRKSLKIILFGIFIMLFLITTFNFVLPAFFNNSTFIPLGAVFLFPFISFTAYAILKHRLFNIKVAATALIVFILSIGTFLEVIFTDPKNLSLIIFRGSVFILVLSFGILLIRSVLKEVEAREKIQKQEKEMEIINEKLAEANDRQEGLIHFISHEVKGYLTKGRNAFSVISDGDYGQVSPDLKALVDRALHEMTEGVSTVMNILQASNLKKGTITYKMVPFDFKNAVSKIVTDLKPSALEKGLTFDFIVDEKQDYKMNGDEENITKHVLRNLVDNAVRYTPSGNIRVELSKSNGKILFSVKDSGVGITEKDKAKLFTEGGKGTNSMKVNVNSTGYGLYIAKEIVLAHHGRIWAESQGEGKGSQFFVEF